MATTPTTGDIPSNAAVDLKFNSEQFDRVMNSDDLTYSDRFGKKRITMKGVQELANGFQDTFTNLLGSPDGFKLIGGVKSFDTLRSTPVRTEGQRIFLKSYYENGVTGSGIFIGHIGTKLDDGGTVAQGVGYYWERIQFGSSVSIMDFGCRDNSDSDFAIFDNRARIQAAVDYANNRYVQTGNKFVVDIPAGVYRVTNRTITPTGSSTANGILSIEIKSGVKLKGEGTIKPFASAYGTGAYYRVIGSDKGALISDVEIVDITIDGIKTEQIQSSQCSNIVIEGAAKISVKNVKSLNANGNGIMIRGNTTTPCEGIEVVGCVVDDVNMIGIQCSQFINCVISSNIVMNTVNNGIDIYGDTGVSAGASNANNFSICNNALSYIGVGGIFPETSANGSIVGNTIYDCQEGIHSNRIKSVPKNILISGNTITKSTVGGIIVTGDHEAVTIIGNTISDFNGGGILLGTNAAEGNVSGVNVNNNTFNPTDLTSYIVSVKAVIASRIEVRNNFIRNAIGLPATNYVYREITTTSGVNIDSWAVTHSGTSTGLQMYRMGTFTPTVFGQTTAGAYTYTTQSGTYQRIGNVVTFQINVVWTAGTGVGPLYIGGLPFTPSIIFGQPDCEAYFDKLAMTAYGQFLTAAPKATGLSVRLMQHGVTGPVSYPAAASYPAGSLMVKGFYFVD